GMLNWDYPSLCKTCIFTNKPRPEIYLPFVADALGRLGRKRQTVDCTLEVEAPAHMTRAERPPVLRLHQQDEGVQAWFVALALAGRMPAGATASHRSVPASAATSRTRGNRHVSHATGTAATTPRPTVARCSGASTTGS